MASDSCQIRERRPKLQVPGDELLVMAFAPAAAAPPDNPFVGSWESVDELRRLGGTSGGEAVTSSRGDADSFLTTLRG